MVIVRLHTVVTIIVIILYTSTTWGFSGESRVLYEQPKRVIAFVLSWSCYYITLSIAPHSCGALIVLL